MSGDVTRRSAVDATNVLASFVPRGRLAHVVRTDAPFGPRTDRTRGAVLFIDVVGFTSLAERLSRDGAEGSEQLSRVIDACFGRMTDIVLGLEGDVVTFAGDAMLAMWPVAPDRDMDVAVHLAAAAALRVQEQQLRIEAAPKERLRLRAAVSCGSLLLHEVGGVGDRWLYLVGGPPLNSLFEADHRANPGDVVVAPAAARFLEPDGSTTPLADGFHRLVSEPRAPATGLYHASEVRDGDSGRLRSCVPPFVAARVDAGQTDWLAEFRSLTVAFVQLQSREAAGALAGPALHQAYQRIQKAVERSDGTVYQALVDDKGVGSILAFGLPTQALGNDAVRAVRCAMDVQGSLAEIGLDASVGIASGLAFTGIYGTPSRRQYTLVGFLMNRGARLAQAAEGGILCDDATRKATERAGRFAFTGDPPLSLKGISDPVPAWRPLPPRVEEAGDGTKRSRELVGRASERGVLEAAVAGLVEEGRGGFVLIEGEAGIGKSHLAAYALQCADRAGVRLLEGHGLQLEQRSVLHAWRSVFEDLLDVDGRGTDPDVVRATLIERFAGDPERLELLPLLGAVLPAELRETERTAAMPAEARAEATREFLVSLLRDASADRSSALLLEDVHWFDSASLALLAAVAESVPGLLVVATARPVEADEPALRHRLSDLAGDGRLVLEGMGDSDLRAVLRAALGVERVDDEVMEVVRSRARGNPFFCEQIALALRDFDLVRVDESACSASSDADDLGREFDEQLSRSGLPGSVQGIIRSRVDRLEPGPQLAIRLASVIGPRFELRALEGIHPEPTADSGLKASLEELVRHNVAEPDDTGPADVYRFSHGVLRDVVYNSLTFRQRQSTHAAVAEWLEAVDRGAEARYYPLLAHHWTHARVHGKATTYLALAGDDALARYANQEAVRFFKDAIAIDDDTAEDGAPSPERAAWELQLGAAYVNWSRYDEAREHLGRGLGRKGHRAPGTPVPDAFHLAVQMLRQVAHRTRPDRFVGKHAAVAGEFQRMARAYESLVEAFYLDNAPVPCLLSAVRSLNLAELGGPSAELARGYASFAAILGFVPARRLADAYFERAIRTASEVGEASARAWVGLAAGVYGIGVADWEEAGRHLRDTRDTAEHLGDRRRWDDAMQNLAALNFLRGRYTEAEEEGEKLRASASARKDERALAVALRRLALCKLARNDLTEIVTYLDALDSYAEGSGDVFRDLPPLALRAQWHLREGRDGDAIEAALPALRIASDATPTFHDSLSDFFNTAHVVVSLHRRATRERTRSDTNLAAPSRAACRSLRKYARVFPIGRPFAHLCEGVRLDAAGRSSRAAGQWRRAITTAEESGLPHCEGLARLELGQLLGGEEGRRELSAAEAIFARLGAGHELELARTSLARV